MGAGGCCRWANGVLVPLSLGVPQLSPVPREHVHMWQLRVRGDWLLLTLGWWDRLSTGQLEVVLDRRLMQDDNRGLGQGLKDNKRTCNRFRLLLERRSTANKVRGLQGCRTRLGHGAACWTAQPSHGTWQEATCVSGCRLSSLLPLALPSCWHGTGTALPGAGL